MNEGRRHLRPAPQVEGGPEEEGEVVAGQVETAAVVVEEAREEAELEA